MGSALIRWVHFRAISVCARCRSGSAIWVEGFRSRALQGKEPTFLLRFHWASVILTTSQRSRIVFQDYNTRPVIE